MKPHLLAVAAAATITLGCAAKPENIQPALVSQARYSDMSCEQLRVEMEIVDQRLVQLSERQRANRTRDGLLNALVIPGLGAATPDQEDAIAQAKGEQVALQRESVRCTTSQ